MPKKIEIVKYKKLSNISFEFNKNINVLSGTNGTCKTSLLHIISNSCKNVSKTNQFLNDHQCLDSIKKINNILNPKIESLTRGDKQYNDPAQGVHGKLFSVEYFRNLTLTFRRHNSNNNTLKEKSRYAIKPQYTRGANQSLPACPVIYLGLTRLLPFGEYQQDDTISSISSSLPSRYIDEITDRYRTLTGIPISSTFTMQQLGDIKTRADFKSETQGVDSNTISAGEENLLIIITAIVSLKYFFNSINSTNDVESILLIDELDATLHPSIQTKVLDLLEEYSLHNKIQVFLTTHSLHAIEYAIARHMGLTYLINNVENVIKMESPDIYKIKMYLQNTTAQRLYIDIKIPIFSEDKEARLFIDLLFNHIERNMEGFQKVRRFFHLVSANIGAGNLQNIFNDIELFKSTSRFICILDGDQRVDLHKYTTVLPGGESPEILAMNHSKNLFDKKEHFFWKSDVCINEGFGTVYYQDAIEPDINNINGEIERLRTEGQTTRGVRRDKNKKVFNDHIIFFKLMLIDWIEDVANERSVSSFARDLNILFKKVAPFYGINPNLWNIID